ncbi:hypothetical protein BX600DRAFT_505069 [Xylariales sp. PMI_506]|nr:hypothetical protein BX600DRAFT_505069 [Xylariales sp. PMI_506]
MLSVASLLNPEPPGQAKLESVNSTVSSLMADSAPHDTIFFRKHIIPKSKLHQDAVVFTKGRIMGAVNFYPYEKLDDESLRSIQEYQVYPASNIQDYCRHIPYNSGKKDFFEKTGRESFEVFQYTFKAPDDNNQYVVMWDYNIGLVRMTPFFKCCHYPKTTPAKMLNANPGLKEISHSITGGSIMAQGYWMPYECAKAVCATFCFRIAAALIPIFGPEFPAQCVRPGSTEYGRMIIDPTIVAKSTREAGYFRSMYATSASLRTDRYQNQDHRAHDNTHRRNHFCGRGPSTVQARPHDVIGETTYHQQRFGDSHTIRSAVAQATRKRSTAAWEPTAMSPQHQHPHGLAPSPWLTALPDMTKAKMQSRFKILKSVYANNSLVTTAHGHSKFLGQSHWRSKRTADYIDMEDEYDGGYSTPVTGSPSTAAASPFDETLVRSSCSRGVDQNAALLLMNLSVLEPHTNFDSRTASTKTSPVNKSCQRAKRPRANSA